MSASEPGDLVRAARELVLGDRLERLADELDGGATLPEWAIDLVRDAGLLTLRLPREHGGRQLSAEAYCDVIEQVAHGPAAVRVLVHGQNGKWQLFERAAPVERARYLARFGRGDVFLSFAFTEPDRGTGTDIATAARRVDGGWAIDGRKHLVTWATRSETFVVVAKTELEPPELSCFLVPANASGLRIDPMPQTLGMRGCGVGELRLDDCRVPEEALLGGAGEGLAIAFGFLDFSRISLAASSVGLAQRALDLSCDFAESRRTFGKAIAERQAVQLMIADMQTAIEASRQLVRHAARTLDATGTATAEAAAAKLHTMTTVTDVTDLALRIHGGIGYTQRSPIERLYRDARSYWFEEGTREVQSLVVARDALARRRAERAGQPSPA